jgi:hypothetical protein
VFTVTCQKNLGSVGNKKKLTISKTGTVWSPYTKKDIELIENVQRRATKQVPSLKQLSYTDRLKKLKMPMLKYHRLKGITLPLHIPNLA